MQKFIWAAVAIYLAIFLTLLGGRVLAAPQEVSFKDGTIAPGTIVVKNSERRLYLVESHGKALRYQVAVGKRGKVWTGRTYITAKYVKPAWAPPAEVKRDLPHLPDVIAGGAPDNPMGVAAMTPEHIPPNLFRIWR